LYKKTLKKLKVFNLFLKFRMLINLLIYIFLLLSNFDLISQSSYRWKRMRYELIGGLGFTNCLTDIGGADQIGTNFVKDLELSMTKMCLNFGLRYRLSYSIYTKLTFAYGVISGDDKLTKEPSRNYRNISFKTDIFELANTYEFSIVTEKEGARYNLRRVRGMMSLKLNIYFFFGGGVFFYNPKGYYNGKWYALQPLGTEGQGILESRKKYSRIGFCIPWGVGLNYLVGKRTSLGFELGVRKTFTDYLDDTSTNYVDKELIRQNNGDIAAYFADPSSGEKPNWTAPNCQRGDPKDKDVYIFLFINLTYKLKTTRSGLPKFFR